MLTDDACGIRDIDALWPTCRAAPKFPMPPWLLDDPSRWLNSEAERNNSLRTACAGAERLGAIEVSPGPLRAACATAAGCAVTEGAEMLGTIDISPGPGAAADAAPWPCGAAVARAEASAGAGKVGEVQTAGPALVRCKLPRLEPAELFFGTSMLLRFSKKAMLLRTLDMGGDCCDAPEAPGNAPPTSNRLTISSTALPLEARLRAAEAGVGVVACCCRSPRLPVLPTAAKAA